MTIIKEQVIDGVKIITQSIPWYKNIWLGIAILAVIILIIFIVFYFIRIRYKNRLLVIIHYPDKTRKSFGFHKFVGNEFKILTGEVTNSNEKIKHTYFFKPECVETGFWGRYIEYDFKISEPLNPKDRFNYNQDKPRFFKFISGLLDTQLATDLLLSSKWKEFVKIFLIIILVVSALTFILVIAMPFMYQPVQQCVLVPSNITEAVIRSSLTMN